MEHNAVTKEIWSQMHQRLLSYVRRRVATPDDAEDILQEVFVRIHANLPDLKDTQHITAWVYRIAHNAIIDYYRERARDTSAIKELAHAPIATAQPSDDRDQSTGDASDPSVALAGCMEPLVRRLPERYHRAVTLTELEGLTQKEAAQKLGLSVSGLKSRVQRGRSKLKELLLDCCHVEMDSRRRPVDFEPRDGSTCGGDCGCG